MNTHSTHRALVRLCMVALPCITAAGCRVGPNYHRPDVVVAPEFRHPDPVPAATTDTTSLADLPWWQVFNDPQLQTLVNQAMVNNYDIQVAIARIEQARALFGVARSGNKPQVGYNADGGGASQVIPLSDGIDQVTWGGIAASVNAFWELDVWGRVRSSKDAARARLYAQEDIRRGVQLMLVSDIAAAYFRLLSLDRELVIADSSAVAFQRNVELFTLRFEAGRDTRLPVERAQANYDNSRDRIAELKQAIGQQENVISALLGANPAAIARGRTLGQQTMPQTPVGLTTALLQRRPDIRAAEQNMVNASAQVRIAFSEYFPKIGLSALLGGRLIGINDLVSDAFGMWNLGASVAGPIYNGGRIRETKNNREAFWDETVAQYRKTIVTAFQETSDVLIAQKHLADRRTALESRVGALQRAVELATFRYDAGRASYFEVLEAEQQLFPAQYALTQVQRDQLIVVVNLYKTLGGGWQLQPDAWVKPGQ